MTEAQLVQADKMFLDYIVFSDSLPEVSGLFGGGDCLWIAGTAPEDTFDGTSLTLLGINIAERRQIGAVRLQGSDWRILVADSRGIYATGFDADDRPILVRFDFPAAVHCGS